MGYYDGWSVSHVSPVDDANTTEKLFVNREL